MEKQEKVVLTLDSYEPVSYTHLDVYKRQLHTCVTAAALGSMAGGDAANREKIMQANTMMAPSKHTAA